MREIVGLKTRIRKIILYVVEGHDDHYGAANNLDGFDADAFSNDRLGHRTPFGQWYSNRGIHLLSIKRWSGF